MSIKTPSPLLALVEALRVLPGVGPKSAQRIASYLLQHNRSGAQKLGQTLINATQTLKQCIHCNNFTDAEICDLCRNHKRDNTVLCVVETAADLLVMEQTQSYKGSYFVLMGRLSPLDGIGPNELNFDGLLKRATDGVVKEVILATNFTSEGEATAHYLAQLLKTRQLTVTRLARGVPIGGELEYVDVGTIASALADRRKV